MQRVSIDEKRLESIALLLSASINLPHGSYHNRHKRFCYIVPVENPSFLVSSLAFRNDTGVATPNQETLGPIPLTGDICVIQNEQMTVCTFIAYSIFKDRQMISSHCEKIIMSVSYVTSLSNNNIIKLNSGDLLEGLPLSVTENVTSLDKYRK